MPTVIGSAPCDRWEGAVLKAFKAQLPDDWVVMPSVKWTLAKNGYVRDGEADFVVLVPGSGLVVVEVKGSREFRVGEDGQWSRLETGSRWIAIKEPPPEQAMRNMHDLVGCLMARNAWTEFPGRFAYLVIYPQGEARALPPMFDESTIATYRHMGQLSSRVRNALDRRGGDGVASRFTAPTQVAVIDQLKNRRFEVTKVDSGEDMAVDAQAVETLTRQQFATLGGLFRLPRVAVIGPAGSGKTLLAMWHLRASLEQGLRAIYICYNRALAESLRIRNPDVAASIWSIDRFFLDLCPDVRDRAGNTNFHREVLPSLVMDRSVGMELYETIIVDEGQDFSEEQVIAMLELVSDEGVWSFFADWKQDLYSAGRGTPIGAEVVFHLSYNCRNAIRINDASNSLIDTRVESMPGMPEGVFPRVEYSSAQASRAWELARQWAGEGSVVILSPFKLENSAMAGQASGHGLLLSTALEDIGVAGRVYFSTIKSFKGMEADAVILVDSMKPGSSVAFGKEDLYVACTRATSRLAVICAKQDVANDLKATLRLK